MPLSKAEKRLARTELRLRSRAHGLQRGDHVSRLAGEGLEVRDIREYQPGDDIRQMAWPVTARTGNPHISTFDTERAMTVWFLVDTSESMNWGTANCTKADLALDLVAGLCVLVTRRGNRIGGGPLSGERLRLIRPAAGRAAAVALIRRIETFERESAFDRSDLLFVPSLGTSLARHLAVLNRRGLVIVISDFLDSGFERPLGELTRRHEVIALRVSDPREHELTDIGIVYLRDPESHQVIEVDTSDRHTRAIFRASARTQSRRIAESVRRTGAALLELSTENDWVDDLLDFIDMYPHRR